MRNSGHPYSSPAAPAPVTGPDGAAPSRQAAAVSPGPERIPRDAAWCERFLKEARAL